MSPYGDAFAKFYDRHFGVYAENAVQPLLQFASNLPGALKELPVLELGCGTGRLAFHFLSAGYSWVGLDLSPSMLSLAQARCSHSILSGKASFLQQDIRSVQAGGPFGLSVATYNVLNHLGSEKEVRECFQGVHHALAKGGTLLFDYNTFSGLREWASKDSARWQDEKLEIQGSFNEADRMATIRLEGEIEGESFQETVVNYSFPLGQLGRWLHEEGFKTVDFRRMDDLARPLAEPEKGNRVVVLAQ